MSDLLGHTLNELRDRAAKHDAVLVCYSGGKDSLVVLDLCTRVFSRVVALHLPFIPGMPWSVEMIDYAKSRWGVEVVQAPSPTLIQAVANGIYRISHHRYNEIKDIGFRNTYHAVADDLGIDCIATGAKRIDSFRTMGKPDGADTGEKLFCPIYRWRTAEVIAYLAANGIMMPSSDGRRSSGFDLTTPNILWMHDERPQDYEYVRKFFPLVEAVVKRREFYGVPAR
jgi:phosphoadenosine phosphosulfate reductase